MAKVKSTLSKGEAKLTRKGVHSKCKTSNSKNSKHYRKKYRGQGK